MKRTKTSISIDPSLWENVADVAWKRRIEKSDIVEQALKQWLATDHPGGEATILTTNFDTALEFFASADDDEKTLALGAIRLLREADDDQVQILKMLLKRHIGQPLKSNAAAKKRRGA